MRYQRVIWHQNSSEYPTVLHSEIDDGGWEVRKVDEYADGHLDLAGDGIETGNTGLGEAPTPPIAEINMDPQFEGVEITAEEFEATWAKAKQWFELP